MASEDAASEDAASESAAGGIAADRPARPGLSTRIGNFLQSGAYLAWSGGKRHLTQGSPLKRTTLAGLIGASLGVSAAGIGLKGAEMVGHLRSQGAARLIENSSKADLARLDHGTIAELIDRTDVRGDRHELWQKLYEATGLDPDYTEAISARVTEFNAWMVTSPAVDEAARGWHEWGWDQRRDFLQTVADSHAEIFGYPASEVRIYDRPRQEVEKGDETLKLSSNGFFRSRDWTTHVNRHPSAANERLDEAMDVTVHELTHAYQYHLIGEMRAGELEPDSPIFDQVEIFALNSRNYVNASEDYDLYRIQPMERDAFDSGEASVVILMNDMENDMETDGPAPMRSVQLRNADPGADDARPDIPRLAGGRGKGPASTPQPPGQGRK